MNPYPPGPAPIPVVASIAPLAERREAFLADIWGVMHDGIRPFAAASAAAIAFRERGGSVLLLSNAPRPAASVMAGLDRIGVPRAAYDAIISSGDAARHMIAGLGGKPTYHIGPERDRGLFEGTCARLTDEAGAAAVVCSGLFDDEIETPGDYAPSLARLAARGLEMICANPDQTVARGGKLVYCAGAIAHAYEAAGGRVVYAGKPYPAVYKMALETIARLRGRSVGREAVLAIGDGIHTDIAGAAAAGIDAVYVASPVHLAAGEGLSAASLDRLFPDRSVRPIAAMTELSW